MAAITPALHVNPPAAGPRRYGLFNAASIQDLPTHGAAGGLEYEPDTCGVTHVYTAECPITDQGTKSFDTAAAFRTEPFIVYGSIVCSPVGRPIAEQQRRAEARLLAGEQTSAEAAFWNGAGVGASPALTLAGATTVVSAQAGFGPRVAALEEAFYDAYGYQGTIHVNTRAVGAAAFAQMTVRAAPPPDIPAHIVTPLGSIWSFGAGYDITGPADVAPAAGSVWAFITPQVTVWRSDVFAPDPSQTFNRTTNQLYAIAEREYTIGYDCPTVFAIELPLEAV